ncbi:hypothetical protein IG631_20696 [Alternaria alternata]|nr:hypothetical protein IG631_20696 [Alternaria alternata]
MSRLRAEVNRVHKLKEVANRGSNAARTVKPSPATASRWLEALIACCPCVFKPPGPDITLRRDWPYATSFSLVDLRCM